MYIALNVEVLWKNMAFRHLLQTLNEFPRGLISVMLSRLD